MWKFFQNGECVLLFFIVEVKVIFVFKTLFDQLFAFQHFFILSNANEMKQKMVEVAATNLGIFLKVLKQQFKQEEFVKHRFGMYRYTYVTYVIS